jgi:hypothetical protein
MGGYSIMREMSITSEPNFEHNGFYERLIEMRRKNRQAFDSLSTPTHYARAVTEEARHGVS